MFARHIPFSTTSPRRVPYRISIEPTRIASAASHEKTTPISTAAAITGT